MNKRQLLHVKRYTKTKIWLSHVVIELQNLQPKSGLNTCLVATSYYDNTPIHKAALTEEYLRGIGFPTFGQPFYNPNLHPVTLFHASKTSLNNIQCFFMLEFISDQCFPLLYIIKSAFLCFLILLLLLIYFF